MLPPAQSLLDRIVTAGRLHLILDYDGTLAEFAPTPDHVQPDPEIQDLVRRLVAQPIVRVSILSGRHLGHVRRLLPVPGVLLAGTYGIEIQTPEGERIERVDQGTVRPALDEIRPRWAALVDGRSGYYLEDKGWALALHARFAAVDESEQVLDRARRIAAAVVDHASPGTFRLLGGHKFLEIGPRLADKGRSVEYLLERYPWPGALLVCMGDDDKDEEAFAVVQARGGVAIVVAETWRPTRANFRLESPRAARAWLDDLLRHISTISVDP